MSTIRGVSAVLIGILVLIMLFIAGIPSAAESQVTITVKTIQSPPVRIEQVAVEFATPQLKRICSCESKGVPDAEPTHYDEKGAVLLGRVNPLDTGACQINKHYHEAKAVSMGFDLAVREDNIEFANWLYKKEGVRPWRASIACWG